MSILRYPANRTTVKLYEYYKSTQADDEKTIKRNEIIIEALNLGIKELKKRK